MNNVVATVLPDPNEITHFVYVNSVDAFWNFFIFLVQIVLNKVLLVGTKTHTYIGKPVVTNATVHAVVENQVTQYPSLSEVCLFDP